MATVQIEDGWVFNDTVTGLKLSVTKGECLGRLNISGVPGCHPRDFFFTHEGTFDGTGSGLCKERAPE